MLNRAIIYISNARQPYDYSPTFRFCSHLLVPCVTQRPNRQQGGHGLTQMTPPRVCQCRLYVTTLNLPAQCQLYAFYTKPVSYVFFIIHIYCSAPCVVFVYCCTQGAIVRLDAGCKPSFLQVSLPYYYPRRRVAASRSARRVPVIEYMRISNILLVINAFSFPRRRAVCVPMLVRAVYRGAAPACEAHDVRERGAVYVRVLIHRTSSRTSEAIQRTSSNGSPEVDQVVDCQDGVPSWERRS